MSRLLVSLALSSALFCRTSAADPLKRPYPIPSVSEASKAPHTHELEIRLLYANNGNRGIDASLRDLPELKVAPFTSYKTYRLREERRLVLTGLATSIFRLPNGRTLSFAARSSMKFALSANVDRSDGPGTLPLFDVDVGPKRTFLIPCQGYETGLLLLVVRVIR